MWTDNQLSKEEATSKEMPGYGGIYGSFLNMDLCIRIECACQDGRYGRTRSDFVIPVTLIPNQKQRHLR